MTCSSNHLLLQKQIIEAAADGIVTLDRDSRFASANAAAIRILGVPSAELIGQLSTTPPYRRLTLAGEPRPDQPTLAELEAAGDQVFHDEYIVERCDGTRVFLSRNITALRDATGQFLGAVSTFTDITAQKGMLEALHQSEARIAFLLKLSDALRPLANPNVVQGTVTQTAMDYFAADRCYYCELIDGNAVIRQDASRKDLPSVTGIYPLDRFPIFKAVVDGGHTFTVHDVNHADSLVDEALRQLCIQMQIISFVDVPVIKNGNPVGLLCLTQSAPRTWTQFEVRLIEDVAERAWTAVERAQSETAVRESEARYRTLFNAMDEGACLFERLPIRPDGLRDYRYIAMNGAMQTMFGISDLSGQSIRDNFPNEVEAWYDDYDRVLETGQPLRFERESAPQGKVLEMFVTRVEDGFGRQLLSVMQDITVRRRAEEALRQSEQKYRALFNSIDAGFCIIEMIYDDAGQPIDWIYLETNPTFFKQSGLSAQGQKVSELIGPVEPFWYTFYDRVCKTGQPERVENRLAALDRWFSIFASRIGGPDSCQLAVVFDDITERKQREQNTQLLDEIGKDLMALSTLDEILEAVSARVGKFLGLSGCQFSDVDEAAEITVHYGWVMDDDPLLRQTFQLNEYLTDVLRRASRTSDITVIRDTEQDTRMNAESYAALKIGALVAVPFRAQGRWTALFSATSAEPRDWRADQIAFLKEAADRLFLRVERIRAEVALRESEQRLVLALDAAAMGTLVWHIDSGHGEPDARMLDLLGLPHDSTIDFADVLRVYVNPDDRARIYDAVQQAISPSGTGQFREDVRIIRPDQTECWLSCIGRTLFEGQPPRAVRVIVVAMDVSSYKQAEATLRESEERFRLLVEGTKEYAMFRLDPRGLVVHWNSGAERVFGYTRDQAMGKDAAMVFTPEDQDAGVPQRELENAALFGQANDQRWHIRRDGSRFWANGVMSSLRDEQGDLRGFVKIARDATHEREAEEALQRAYSELETKVTERTAELQSSQEQLRQLLLRTEHVREEERFRIAREVHDELGGALTGLKFGVHQIGRNLSEEFALALRAELDAQIQELVQTVRRIAAELHTPVLDDFGLTAAIEWQANDWSTKTGIACQVELPTQEIELEKIRRVAMFRVFQETLTNIARHATGATLVSVTMEAEASEVSLAIEDNGCGIDLEKLQPGKSLGLLNMRERMREVDGSLAVISAVGEGMTIIARMPIRGSSTTQAGSIQ